MEGRENTSLSLLERTMLAGMYPGRCGYKSETGGVCLNLRSLTVDTVRAYVRRVCLLVCVFVFVCFFLFGFFVFFCCL
jgi:Zn-dependent M16 (insulinase) family peptidase